MMPTDDAGFHRVTAALIAEELWRCVWCGALVCDRATHAAIHADLNAMRDALAYLKRIQGEGS